MNSMGEGEGAADRVSVSPQMTHFTWKLAGRTGNSVPLGPSHSRISSTYPTKLASLTLLGFTTRPEIFKWAALKMRQVIIGSSNAPQMKEKMSIGFSRSEREVTVRLKYEGKWV